MYVLLLSEQNFGIVLLELACFQTKELKLHLQAGLRKNIFSDVTSI